MTDSGTAFTVAGVVPSAAPANVNPGVVPAASCACFAVVQLTAFLATTNTIALIELRAACAHVDE